MLGTVLSPTPRFGTVSSMVVERAALAVDGSTGPVPFANRRGCAGGIGTTGDGPVRRATTGAIRDGSTFGILGIGITVAGDGPRANVRFGVGAAGIFTTGSGCTGVGMPSGGGIGAGLAAIFAIDGVGVSTTVTGFTVAVFVAIVGTESFVIARTAGFV